MTEIEAPPGYTWGESERGKYWHLFDRAGLFPGFQKSVVGERVGVPWWDTSIDIDRACPRCLAWLDKRPELYDESC